jgi:hypothetical protein
MQRSRDAAGGQGRPYRCRLRARLFLNRDAGGTFGQWRGLRRNCGRRTGHCGAWFDDEPRGGWFLYGGRLPCDAGGAGCRCWPGRLLVAEKTLPDQLRDGLVHGAGVSFLFGHAEIGEHLEDGVRWDLELPCQLVDANFTHRYCDTRVGGRLADLLRVLYGIKFGFGICRICRGCFTG